MPTVLITGANRGLGLEFCRQYLNDGWTVHATCRHPEQASDLNALSSSGNLTVHALDVTQAEAIHALRQSLNTPIDVLMNNAGTAGESGVNLDNFSVENFMHVMHVNAVSPLQMVAAFKDLVAKSELKTIANVTSRMGSITDNTSGLRYAYRTSKTALNAVMRSASVDLANAQIRVLLLHPGWVKTDMGGEDAPVTAAESVQSMRGLIADPNTRSGEFYHANGERLPW